MKPGESPALPGIEDGNAEGARQYLAFALGDRSYAVPLVQIAEISPNRTLNHMPHMPKGVEGLLDLRGTMVPVLNLRCRLGLPPLNAEASENILVVQLGGQPLGLLVDRVQSGEIQYCPHGRPVAVKLSKYQVEKMFKRA